MDTIGIFNGAAGGMRTRFGRTLSSLAASLALGLGLPAAVLPAQAQQPDAAAVVQDGKARAATGPVQLTILYTQGTTDLDETAGRGGMARLAGTIRQERAAHPNLLVLHGGQTLAPSVLAFYDQGAHIIDLLNGMTIDAMAALNREPPRGAALLRMAQQVARAIDRLLVEDVDPEALFGERVQPVFAEMAGHWLENTRLFATEIVGT